jgi:hypothetical protein
LAGGRLSLISRTRPWLVISSIHIAPLIVQLKFSGQV